LREDKKLFVNAASQAVKAVKYILGVKVAQAQAEDISGK
jgi:hypothetical protein